VAISGEQPYPGWSRWETVSGSSPGSPHAVDRVDIATGGEADGEGEQVPPPLSPTLQPSYFSPASPTPPAPSQGYPYTSPAPPPHPRLHRDTQTLPRHPRPACASVGIPVHSLPAPPPRPRLRGDTHTFSTGTPTPPAPSPPPPWGGGSAYDIRWAAVHRIMVTTATGGCHGARAPRRRAAGIAAGALRKGLIGIAGDLMPSPPEP